MRSMRVISLVCSWTPGPLPDLEAEAANLFFQLVSSRYERASLIVTSNKPFGRWGEVFGDGVVAAAMIDRLVHHAEASPSEATATGSATATSAASPLSRPTAKDQQTGEGSTRTARSSLPETNTSRSSSCAGATDNTAYGPSRARGCFDRNAGGPDPRSEPCCRCCWRRLPGGPMAACSRLGSRDALLRASGLALPPSVEVGSLVTGWVAVCETGVELAAKAYTFPVPLCPRDRAPPSMQKPFSRTASAG
jgi:hypothetical protein